MSACSIIAVDIGNARIKLGLFAECCAEGLPEPVRTLPLDGDAPELDQIAAWLDDIPRYGGADIPVCPVECGLQGRQECLPHLAHQWWIASVNRPAATRLIDWLRDHRPGDRVTLLASGDLPLEVRLQRPDMVGIDRLVDAVAVNRLRRPERPAVIVDVGTAITVDLVSADGAFLGGAILPGLQMSARAMHEFTDLLPLVDVSDLATPPPALGTATVPAMESGLFWGAVGAIRQLIEQYQAATGGRAASWGGSSTATPTQRSTATPTQRSTATPTQRSTATPTERSTAIPTRNSPEVFLTGGAGVAVAELLGPNVRYEPNLTLAGIVLTATQGITLPSPQPSPKGRGRTK